MVFILKLAAFLFPLMCHVCDFTHNSLLPFQKQNLAIMYKLKKVEIVGEEF